MLERGHAEVAPPLQDGEEVWYLPVFGVYHPKKKDKIRIVFDSSATYQGLSPNKVLMNGPDLINNLIGVLLRFRKEVVAVIADIEQKFNGFYVAERHRNYLRFLWHRDNDPNQDLIEYRMCVHVFGNSPSPAVAMYGLRRCVQSPSGPDAEAVCNYVLNNFYVDDGLASFSTASEAIRVLQETQETLHQEGKIRPHKIASNCQEILKAFPAEDLASDLKNLDLLQDDLPSHFSLGLCWNISKDAFVFKIPEDCKPCTRRGTLSTVNSLFDPSDSLHPSLYKARSSSETLMLRFRNGMTHSHRRCRRSGWLGNLLCRTWRIFPFHEPTSFQVLTLAMIGSYTSSVMPRRKPLLQWHIFVQQMSVAMPMLGLSVGRRRLLPSVDTPFHALSYVLQCWL